MTTEELLAFLATPRGRAAAVAAGLVLGWLFAWLRRRGRVAEATARAEATVAEARREAETFGRRERLAAVESLAARRVEAEAELADADVQVADVADEIEQAERALDEWHEEVEGRGKRIDSRRAEVEEAEALLAELVGEVEATRRTLRARLHERAGWSEQVARESFIGPFEADIAKETGHWAGRTIEAIENDLDRLAGRILQISISRCQVSHWGDFTPPVVPLGDRKARTWFESGIDPALTEVFLEELATELVYDEDHRSVTISTPDGVKREIARQVVEELVAGKGGRPPKADAIRAAIGRRAKSMDKKLVKVGKWAARQARVGRLDPSLLPLLGRLKFRSSYGQNVLYHSIEVANLTSLIGAELGLDPVLCCRAGLLHDIGKAVDREREGGHPELGAELLELAGEAQPVVEAAFGHHLDPATQPLFPVLVGAADAVSASRAGARRETGDRYAQRLDYIERMAMRQEGVNVAYCVQGGREIRVLVDADRIDDDRARQTARRIADELHEHQKENPFPGQVRVVVIREMRAIEHAR